MNVFNRVVVIIATLLLIVGLIVTTVVPFTVLERLTYALQQAYSTLSARWPWSYVPFLVGAVVLILVLIIVLWLEVRPHAKKTLTVRTVTGTQAEVSAASVEQGLEHHISQVADVYKVKPIVRGKRGGVDVLLELETIPEIDIPAKVEEVSLSARELIEGRMGLHVSDLKVLMKQVAYAKAAKMAPSVTPSPVVMPPSPTDQPLATPPTTDESQPTTQS